MWKLEFENLFEEEWKGKKYWKKLLVETKLKWLLFKFKYIQDIICKNKNNRINKITL